MDLRQLRQFVAVAETLHFGRAAQALAMAQPPLSRAIRGLEDDLGVVLFERSRKKVLLSAGGQALLPEARAVLAAAKRLVESAQGVIAGERGEFTLAFVSIVDYSFLPDLLRRFTVGNPGVRLYLREATSDLQLVELQSGRVDAGILLGPLPPVEATETLTYQRLSTERLVLALPTGHVLAKKAGPAALAKCAGDAFISFPRHVAPRLHDSIMGSCADAGFAPRVMQEAIQMQTIISLVSAGMGIALVPESIMRLRRGGVTYRVLRGARPAFEIGLGWRRDNPSAVLARFVALATAQPQRARSNPIAAKD